MPTQRWPDHPLVPDEWTDTSPYQHEVVTLISEGFCPKHVTPLSRDHGYCVRCRAGYELVVSSGTTSTSDFGPGVFPPWALTDGKTVMVCRDPNWGCEEYYG